MNLRCVIITVDQFNMFSHILSLTANSTFFEDGESKKYFLRRQFAVILFFLKRTISFKLTTHYFISTKFILREMLLFNVSSVLLSIC